MDEADRLSDRIAIIDHGKILATGTPEELKNSSNGEDILQIRVVIEDKKIEESILGELPKVFTERTYADGLMLLGGTDIIEYIPEGYTEKLVNTEDNESAVAEFYGSMLNSRYTIAAIMAADMVYDQGIKLANMTVPATISETFMETKEVKSEFDLYVPGLISLSVLMILFTASASIVKENDKKTLVRLKLSRLGIFNYLVGESVVQAAISIVAISLVVASFLNTVFDVLTVGCFPFFILMFFSGAMFPMPEIQLFSMFGHSIGVTDILPLTHTAKAFSLILNNGAGITDVWLEILMIVILTGFYFVIGQVLYKKRKFSKA